ncbi:MAG: threonine/serine exporter family protein [Bifidobacteriaceae bacterium]|jgi:uncharacterized membrane protein YjjP (DUF1212 family)|nr:threonine/serine exporter family protein [Bifidobacteriaceae bacterium]
MRRSHHYRDGSPGSKNLAAEAHAVVRTGKALMTTGADSYQVRTSMELVAAAIGLDWIQSQVTLSEVTVTLFQGPRFRTQVGQVHFIGVNAHKLAAIGRMVHALTPGTSPQEVEQALDAIDAKKPLFTPPANAAVTAAACTAFAYLAGCGLVELAGVAVASFAGQWLRQVLGRRRFNQYVGTLAASLLTAFLYVGVVAAFGHAAGDHEAAYVAALLYLVPGFPLVTSALDMAKTDFSAGLSRLAYAATLLLAASGGLMAVTWAVDLEPLPLTEPSLPTAIWWLLHAAASFIGVAGFSAMFNATWSCALRAGCIGLVANLLRLVLLHWAVSGWLTSLITALVIGLGATVVSGRWRTSYLAMAVPAALIMVPGVAAFRALIFFSKGATSDMVDNASVAVFQIVGMAIGLAAARTMTDRRWMFDRRQPLN